jgi:hypothetical protein
MHAAVPMHAVISMHAVMPMQALISEHAVMPMHALISDDRLSTEHTEHRADHGGRPTFLDVFVGSWPRAKLVPKEPHVHEPEQRKKGEPEVEHCGIEVAPF